MAQIFLIKGPHTFGYPNQTAGGKPVCHVLPGSVVPVDKLVQQGVLEPIPSSLNEGPGADLFIRDYVHFVAELNKQFGHQLLWWATDLSSKNRYMSKVPDLIGELTEILDAFSRYPAQSILVIDAPGALKASLSKALKKSGILLDWRISQAKTTIALIDKGFKKLGGIFYHAVKYYGRALYAHFYLKSYFRAKGSSTGKYYVIKTFTYNSSWDSQDKYHDTIFGRLPEYLSHKNILIWTFDSRNFRGLIKNILKDRQLFFLPVEFCLSLKDVACAVWEVLFFRIPIKARLFFRDIDVTEIIKHELAETFNGIQMIQYLHYHATKNLAQLLDIETFLLTYENNPWERMCTLALKKYAAGARVMGYSHSIVAQASLNMFLASGEKGIVPLPDKLLINGRIPWELMQRYGDYAGIDVTVTCAFRYEYLTVSPKRLPRTSSRQILVVLDGVRQTKELVDYLLKEASHCPDYKFVVRSHPMLPWKVLASHYGYHLENNMVVSTQGLGKDMEEADIVIYWQSTVSLEALSLGKPLISFSPQSLLSFDPLYGYFFLKWVVTPKDTLSKVFKEIYNLPNGEFDTQYRKSRDFLGEYFYPVTSQRLGAFGV